MATAERGDVNFREPSNGEVDLNVHVVQQNRDYSEHFIMLCVLNFRGMLIVAYS